MKHSLGGFGAVFCLILLLACPALALTGARNGLLLWADVVLPTLLPFMICSGMIVALNGVPLLTKPLFPFYPVLWACPSREALSLSRAFYADTPWEHGWTAVSWKKDGLNLMKPERFLPSATTPAPCLSWVISAFRPHPVFSSSNACPPWIFLTALYLPYFRFLFWQKKMLSSESGSVSLQTG